MSRNPLKVEADAKDQLGEMIRNWGTKQRNEYIAWRESQGVGHMGRTPVGGPPAHEQSSMEQLCSGQYDDSDFDLGDAA